MAVSKRLRYEIFRRDSHACRYCGACAPEAKLTVDHVVPESLGGTDKAENLVTACEACNSGKTSSAPDAPLVADVADDAVRWGAAMTKAAEEARADHQARAAYREQFDQKWSQWKTGRGNKPIPRPMDWPATIERWREAGLPLEVLLECVDIAMSASKITVPNVYRYMCGIAWSKVTEIQERAREFLGAEGPDLAPSATYTYRDTVFTHLFVVWSWAWTRAGGTISGFDEHYFAEEVSCLLDQGKSASHDLTEAAFQAGSDHACDIGSYLPGADQDGDE